MNRDTALRPSDAQVLNNAEQALARRLFREAEEACNAVLRRNLRSSRAHYLLGLSALGQQKPSEAVRRLKKSLQIFPDDINCIVALGQSFMADNRHGDAEECFRKASRMTKGNEKVLPMLVLSLMNQGKFQDALGPVNQLLLVQPLSADAFGKRGYILQQFDKHPEAIGNFTRALTLQPIFPEALNNRGNSFKALNRHIEAIRDYEEAIAQRPTYALPYSNRGYSLQYLKRYDEALKSCDLALELSDRFTDAHVNKGFILQNMQRYEEALTCYKRALAIDSGNWTAMNNMAYTLRQLGRFAESADFYRRMNKLRPDQPEGLWNQGLLKLLMGDMPSGWSDMEWRWKCKEFMRKPGVKGIPEWLGQNIEGRSIAVFTEQGFGDVFQFCRYLPLLADLGAKVTLVAPVVAHRLLSTLDPRVSIKGLKQTLAETDYQCTLLSLPDRFKTELSTIPTSTPYLFAEDNLVKQWKEQIPQKGLRVGISWQGNPKGAVDQGRSFPLSELAPLAKVEGVELISLQYMHGTDQIEEMADQMSLQILDGFNEGPDGFVDTAAVMKNLDLIITSDSAPAHLAGALNVPVWVLLKKVPDWRWLLDREDSPWYPGMRLFRQQEDGDWAGVVKQVVEALKGFSPK
ncbi:MAG: tetratricopeptide repeat protein [Rhizobiaceae bacterium]|nr:tetratricopeptide repeat protein [Rhizobiaceae bacterium]